MSARLIEIARTRELDAELAEFIARDAQLPSLTAMDMGTPEMIELTANRRRSQARDLVQRLWTILESRRVKVLDCDVIEAVDKLRARAKLLA
jgi:hypothetical protein